VNRPSANQPVNPPPAPPPPAVSSPPPASAPAVNLPPPNNRPAVNPLQISPPPPNSRPETNRFSPPPPSVNQSQTSFPETPIPPPSSSLETSSLPKASRSDLRVSANQASPVAQPAPVRPEALQIVPSLPDRNSGKIYRLQVGAYSMRDTANVVAGQLRAAGFHVQIENSASIYRVMAAGIASADVYTAAVRLGSLGFGQIWVKE